MSKFLSVLLSMLVAWPCLAKGPSLVLDKDLSLGGISLGDGEALVLHKLGRPGRISNTGESIRLDYPGLTLWLGEGRRVAEILSTNSQFCSPAGACPGQSFATARAKYGRPLVADREDGRFMEYPSSESSCWLQLAIYHKVVDSIRAECQP
jgi:hypothetical protein